MKDASAFALSDGFPAPDRRVNFYLRMSTLQATVLNVCARAQLSDDFDLSSGAPTHEADSLQSGSLPCAK
jgi:hypothetical protein